MITRLVLDNFRNYDHQELHFTPGANLLLGANGQGKTNILEAVYYMALLRSFRTSQLSLLTRHGSSFFRLYGECQTGEAPSETVRLGVQQGRERELAVDGQRVHRATDFITRLTCAAFIPEDLDIIKGPPGLRRRFINIALCQLQPEYMRTLQAYNNALKSRNEMLRNAQQYQRETVTAYDGILVDLAEKLEYSRHGLAAQLNHELNTLSADFFPDGRLLAVKYLSGCAMLMDELPAEKEQFRTLYRKSLQNSYERDCRDRATRHGSHRSDLACLLNERLLCNYGSEGECRCAALALRLGVTAVLRRHLGAKRLTLLVDDVLGELDSQRQEAFLAHLWPAGQVIFAGTRIPPGTPANAQRFEVRGGTISPASP